MTVFDNPYIKQLGILPYQAQQQQTPLEGLLSPRGLVAFGANMLANPNENFFQQLGQGIGGAVGAVDAYNNSLNQQAMEEAKYNLMVAGLASDYDVAQMQAQAATAQQQMLMNAFGRLGMLGGGIQAPTQGNDLDTARNQAMQLGILGASTGNPAIVSLGQNIYNQAKDQYERQTGSGATEGERKAAGFAQRMLASEEKLKNFSSEAFPSVKTDIAGSVPVVGNYLERKAQTPEQQQFKQAASEWIRAKLRKESGAAIGKDEMEKEFITYFPQVGDSPEVVEQKRLSRIDAIKSLTPEIGKASPFMPAQNIDSGMGISGLPEPTPEGGIIGDIKSKLPETKKQKNRLKYNPSTGDFE